jgi:hypothetical protein
MKYLAAALLLVFTATPLSAGTFTKAQRQDYIKNALAAVLTTSKQNLENLYQFVTVVEQSSCHSAFEALTLSCLQEQVERNCKSGDSKARSHCPILSDLIVVNKLNEKQFVTRDERLQLTRQESGGSYATQYTRMVSRKYSLMVTEELLLGQRTCSSEENGCLAREVDDYCIGNSDVKNLPWQACVSAIVWYIGVNR